MKQLGERLEREPTPQDVLLYGLLEPRNLLDIVRNFVVFEVEGGRSVRKLTRYKQFIAVNEAMGRIRTARKPSERGGIVWHTQGSGKSLTMLWLALKLRRDAAQLPWCITLDNSKGISRLRFWCKNSRVNGINDLPVFMHQGNCHPENKVSLGLVEGVNNKIRVLQRRAYGYRDEEYLKLKIVAAFLPPLPRNAVFNPHESA